MYDVFIQIDSIVLYPGPIVYCVNLVPASPHVSYVTQDKAVECMAYPSLLEIGMERELWVSLTSFIHM